MHSVIELLTRTLCDTGPPAPADAAYLYCQTTGSETSVFQTAKALITGARVSRILILKAGALGGYPGFDAWEKRLRTMGLPANRIEGVHLADPVMIHTRIESEALVRHAQSNGYRSLFVVAPPFHQLRAFMTAATVTMQEYPVLAIYNSPGQAMRWQESVVHSQGTLQASRAELIRAELDRIDRYQKKGDLASFARVLAYLNARG